MSMVASEETMKTIADSVAGWSNAMQRTFDMQDRLSDREAELLASKEEGAAKNIQIAKHEMTIAKHEFTIDKLRYEKDEIHAENEVLRAELAKQNTLHHFAIATAADGQKKKLASYNRQKYGVGNGDDIKDSIGNVKYTAKRAIEEGMSYQQFKASRGY